MIEPYQAESQTVLIDEIISAGQPARLWPERIRRIYRLSQTKRILREGPLHLVLGLLFSISILAIDTLIARQVLLEAMALRILAVAPFTLIGLWALRHKKFGVASACMVVSMTGFAMASVYLIEYFPPKIAARFHFGVAILPVFGNIVLPLSRRNLFGFNVTYASGTILALALWASGGIIGHIDLVIIMLVGAVASHQIVQKQEELRQRNFLLDLRGRVTTVELYEANRQLQHLSERDPLTGLPNRRFFEQAFEDSFTAGSGNDKDRVALMMIDLDHFKQFNDRHGHQAGDQCLRLVGVAISGVLREAENCFARYGGEEFVLVMRETKEGEAEALAKRICRAVADLPGRVDNLPLVTTSIGVAIAPIGDGFTREDLTEMADVALYSAKAAGRNRFEIVEASRAAEAQARCA